MATFLARLAAVASTKQPGGGAGGQGALAARAQAGRATGTSSAPPRSSLPARCARPGKQGRSLLRPGGLAQQPRMAAHALWAQAWRHCRHAPAAPPPNPQPPTPTPSFPAPCPLFMLSLYALPLCPPSLTQHSEDDDKHALRRCALLARLRLEERRKGRQHQRRAQQQHKRAARACGGVKRRTWCVCVCVRAEGWGGGALVQVCPLGAGAPRGRHSVGRRSTAHTACLPAAHQTESR